MSITHLSRLTVLAVVVSISSSSFSLGQTKQTPDAQEAYRVCEEFLHLLGKDLDFAPAYEATFTKSSARRRAIAIADGEFGHLDYENLDDQTLIKAYKLRMQIFYLILPLINPSDDESRIFFPPEIKQILDRKGPDNAKEFGAYVSKLQEDEARFRAHVHRLNVQNASVAKRIADFKADAVSAKFKAPASSKLEPLTGYYRSSVLRSDESYYQIEGFAVARDEDGQMRIVGVRFFSRLF